MDTIQRFEQLLADGQDNALLRFTLGGAYINIEHFPEAIEHLSKAVELDPNYSAAWKLYGKALAASGATDQARKVYGQGIAVAEQKGDIQAAKEMKVYLRRLE